MDAGRHTTLRRMVKRDGATGLALAGSSRPLALRRVGAAWGRLAPATVLCALAGAGPVAADPGNGALAAYDACLERAETSDEMGWCADDAINAPAGDAHPAFVAFLRELGDAMLDGQDTGASRQVVADAAARLAAGRADLLAGLPPEAGEAGLEALPPPLAERWRAVRDADCAGSGAANCAQAADILLARYLASF